MQGIRWLVLTAAPFALQPGDVRPSPALSHTVTQSRVIAALHSIPTEARGQIDATTDLHQVLLARGDIALTELARRLCLHERSSSIREANSLSGVYEPHGGQTLLALSTVAIHAGINEVPVCNVSVRTLILRETSKPAYHITERFISESLAPLLRAEAAKAPSPASADFAEWLLSPPRRRLRQRLTGLDLSWYGQLMALRVGLADGALDGRSPGSHHGYASLRRAIDVQLQYTEAHRRYPFFNYVTENGVHTLAMLLVAIEVLQSHPGVDADRALDTYRASARELFAALTSTATLDGPDGPADVARSQMRAHLLHLALCEPLPLLSLQPERSPELLDKIARQVLADVETRIIVPSAGWQFHAKEALLRLLHYMKDTRRDSDFADCASV